MVAGDLEEALGCLGGSSVKQKKMMIVDSLLISMMCFRCYPDQDKAGTGLGGEDHILRGKGVRAPAAL